MIESNSIVWNLILFYIMKVLFSFIKVLFYFIEALFCFIVMINLNSILTPSMLQIKYIYKIFFSTLFVLLYQPAYNIQQIINLDIIFL